MRHIPNGITILGFVLRLLFVGGVLDVWAAIVGTALDDVDGYVARRFGWTSTIGAELDWHADCAVALLATVAIVGSCGPTATIVMVAAMVIAWARNRATGTRVSFAASSLAVLAIVRWVR